MFKLKTQPSLHNLKELLFENKVLLFCHCNNVNAASWFTFKKKLSKVVKINALLVKSKIAKNSPLFASSKSQLVTFLSGLPEQPKQRLPALPFWDTRLEITKNSLKKEKNLCHKLSWESKKKKELIKVKILEPLLQGPTFIIGCPDEKTAIQVANFVDKGESHFLVLGGFLNNTVLTHLDISLLKTINTSIWAELIGVMQSSAAKTLDLTQSPTLSLISICSYIKKF